MSNFPALPEYLKGKVSNVNAAAVEGISSGSVAQIRLRGKEFFLEDAEGNGTAFPPNKMVEQSDKRWGMPVVILAAKPELTRSWYVGRFNPDAEDKSPQCFSNDNLRPDSSVANPPAETCAACPNNAFGSAVNEDGSVGKGKACREAKILAVGVVGFGTYRLKLPAMSMRLFKSYVAELSAHGIALDGVVTSLSFSADETFPQINFSFYNYIPEESLPALAEKASSPEVMAMLEGYGGSAAPALPAPPVKQPVIEAPKVEQKPEIVVEKAPEVQVEAPPAPQKEEPKASTVSPSDADLAAALGITL